MKLQELEHEIPYTTLKDHLSGKVTKPGLSPYLTGKEELELKDYLVKCSEIVCGKTKRDDIVRRTVQKKGREISMLKDGGYGLCNATPSCHFDVAILSPGCVQMLLPKTIWQSTSLCLKRH